MSPEAEPPPSFWRSRITWGHLLGWLVFLIGIRFEFMAPIIGVIIVITALGNIFGYGMPILANLAFLVLLLSERNKSTGVINFLIFLSFLLLLQIGATYVGLQGAAAH